MTGTSDPAAMRRHPDEAADMEGDGRASDARPVPDPAETDIDADGMGGGALPSQRAVGGSQTVDRALMLLKLIAVAPADGLRLLDVALASGLDRATTYRLLNSLVAQNFIEQDTATKRYMLGLEFFALAAAASNRFDLAGQARATLRRLSAASGDTATHCLKSALNLVCMDVETGHFPIRTLPMDIGSHRPIGGGATGIAYLAAVTDAEIEDILKKNARRLAKLPGQSPAVIRAAIADCRRVGYAIGPDEPNGRIWGLAIPQMTRHNRPLGTLSLNGIPDRFTPDRIPGLVALLRDEAKAMADAIVLMPNEERHRSRWESARRRKTP